MSLVYRKSTKSVARKYERSPGMEPNVGGVTHMTVINPGRPPQRNPFQWISGRGRSHHHLSPPYRTMQGARKWAERHPMQKGRLVAVDEYGTIITRPLSRKQVLRANTGRSSMSYHISSLRRAMRRNSTDFQKAVASSSAAERKRHSRAASRALSKGTHVSGGKVTAKAVSKAASTASKAATSASKASTRAKKASTPAVAKQAAKSAKKAASRAKKAASKAVSKAKKAKPSSKKAASKAATKAKRAAAKAAKAAEAAEVAATRASRRLSRRGRISGKMGSLKLKGSPSPTYRLFNPPFNHITGFERVAKGKKRTSRRISKKKLAANLLAATGHRNGMPSGRRVQVVQFGPRSRRKGYAVYIPGHVSERAYVRRFKFGGAAKRAHRRAMQFGYSRRKSSSKPVMANGRSSMRRNSRRRSRRHSRRHSRRVSANRYVVVKNRRRSRRLRRNMTIFGVDPINQVVIPGGYAVGGLMLANAAANLAAGVPQITGVLDAGRPDALVTKSLVGAGVAGLTLAFAGKLPAMVRDNLTPIVAGMGCAVAVRLLRGTQAAPYLGNWGAGFGEYVDQPLGAYVQDPSLGEYVDQPLGEYVDQPLGGLGAPTLYAAAGYPEGIDPGDQGSIDGLMDVAEAAAGVGPFEAAAGMGTFYAAAGLGDGTTGVVGSPIPVPTFTPPVGPGGNQQPPFVSIETPIDMAKEVNRMMPRDLPIPTSMVTPEGRGSAGGIFSRSIFGGMMS